MRTRIPFVFVILAILVWTAVGQTSEKDWVQHVIPDAERSFDFKTVAKGAAPEHPFVLRNPLQEPIHIGGITSSCTCTTIDFDTEKSILQTYDELIVTARLRGDMFEGQRNATLTVIIDQPNRAEIQLNIRGEIRNDLKITPNSIDFGNVEKEKGQSRTLTVTYTGSNTQWRLVDVKCENEFIRTEITNDPAVVGKKVFKVNVSLDESAPNGNISGHLFLISNDSGARREIPIPFRATIGTVIKVSPPALSLGTLLPGEQSPTKNVVLFGTKPFQIVKIECNNPAIEIPLKISTEPKTMHSIPVSYRNPVEGEGSPKDGTMLAEIRITTDIPGLLPTTFYVTMSVRKKENAE